MWQSPEDPNNPWQPFRAGQIQKDWRSNNIGHGGFSGQPPTFYHTEFHCDENWNSVKAKNTFNGQKKDFKESIRGHSIGEKVTRPSTRSSKNEHESFQDSKEVRHDVAVSQDMNDVAVENCIGYQNDFSHTGYDTMVPADSAAGTFQGNQWSPFLQHSYWDVSGGPGEVDRHVAAFQQKPSNCSLEQAAVTRFSLKSDDVQSGCPEDGQFDYRQPGTDNSYYSERSSYSTDTDEDVGEDYEFVEKEDKSYRDYNHNLICTKDGQTFDDRFNTPPTSPSMNDKYHTAPNSPRQDHDFCVVHFPEDFNQNDNTGHEAVAIESQSEHDDKLYDCDPSDTSIPRDSLSDMAHGAEPVIQQSDEACACSLETFTDNITACLEEAANESNLTDKDKQDIANFRRFSDKFDRSRIPKMALPPFIDVENIQYEADPKTGAVRTVGKGSFGQVFKARFADPALQHLRIVVKEFNEEYTNRTEILDEARRLLYLGDTGYVPICYGLVCLGDVNNPTYGLVQEYVGSGLTLEQVLWDQYDLEIHLWLSIAFQACEGLARFHEKGILLNDIKSNNIILEFFRAIVRIKYIDFGLATDMRGKRYKNTKSLEDYIYLAPEVRKDGCRTNIASDIFSLGYMLEQICSIAGVHELGFMIRLCMDVDPDSRLPVRAAANIIYKHMATFRYDTSSLCR